MFCPNCGAQASDGAGFCPKCGAALGSRAAAPAPHAPAAAAAAPRGPLSRPAARAAAAAVAAAAALAVAFLLAKAFLPGLLGLTFVNEAAFPDEGFRAFVSEKVDLDGNGILTPEEKGAVQVIDFSSVGGTVSTYEEKTWAVEDLSAQPVSAGAEATEGAGPGASIGSLEGLKRFEDLRVLDCSGLGLSELDLSGNPNLEYVSCLGNEIQSLDLSKNAGLTTLYCDTDVSLEGLGDANLYFTELPVEVQSLSSNGYSTTYQISYDSFGRMRENSYELGRSNESHSGYSDVYSYDESGRLIKKEEYPGSGTCTLFEYEYDGTGRLVSYSLDYKSTVLGFTYEYDDAGRLVEESSGLSDFSEGHDYSYGYGEGGMISSCVTTHSYRGSGGASQAGTYSFDEDGLLASFTMSEDGPTVESVRSESGFLKGWKTIYSGDFGYSLITEYDENGFPVETISRDLTSDSSETVISYEVDADGYVISATYSMSNPDMITETSDGRIFSATYVKRVGSFEDRSSLKYLPSFGIKYCRDNLLGDYSDSVYSTMYPISAIEQGPELQPRREAGLVETFLSNPNESMLEAYDKAFLQSDVSVPPVASMLEA